jgi:hypothetical protein
VADPTGRTGDLQRDRLTTFGSCSGPDPCSDQVQSYPEAHDRVRSCRFSGRLVIEVIREVVDAMRDPST